MTSCNFSLLTGPKDIFSVTTSSALLYVAIILSVMGTILNLLVILALLTSRRLRDCSTSLLIVGVAVGDFLWSIFVLPVMAVRFYTLSWDHVGSCTFFPVMEHVILGGSVLCLMFAIVNWTCVLFYREGALDIFTSRASIFLIIFAWGLPLLLLSPSLTGAWGEVRVDNFTRMCQIMENNSGSPLLLFNDLIFIIPCITMFICISLDLWKLCSKANEATTAEQKFMMMLCLIFLMFLLCIMPDYLLEKQDPCYKYPTLHTMSFITIWSCVVICPTIMLTTNRGYRNAVVAMGKRVAAYLVTEQTWNSKPDSRRMSRMVVPDFQREISSGVIQ